MKAGYDFYINFYKNKNFRNNQNYILGDVLIDNIILNFLRKDSITSIVMKDTLKKMNKKTFFYYLKRFFLTKKKRKNILKNNYIFNDRKSVFFGKRF